MKKINRKLKAKFIKESPAAVDSINKRVSKLIDKMDNDTLTMCIHALEEKVNALKAENADLNARLEMLSWINESVS